jgi:hypothetical protein
MAASSRTYISAPDKFFNRAQQRYRLDFLVALPGDYFPRRNGHVDFLDALELN